MSAQMSLKEKTYGVLKEYIVLGVIVAFAIVTFIVEPNFGTVENMTNIMRQFGPHIMVAFGMTFVIIGGFIDLSVAGIVNLVVVTSLMSINTFGQIPALCIGLGLGLACGFLNSVVVLISGAITQAEALFITYGMSVIYTAIAHIITGGATDLLNRSKNNYSIYTAIGSGTVGMFSVSFIIFFVVLVILYIFQTKTYAGRTINYIGGNKTAARLSGISINKTIMLMYSLAGLLYAMGAIILFARITQAKPTAGLNFETLAIMAVVVGGSKLCGGKGSVLKTVIGVWLVILIGNCLNLLGAPSHLQNVFRGAILIFAVWVEGRKEK
jgi:ribose transport system permease protein